jgi:hypothetical protein
MSINIPGLRVEEFTVPDEPKYRLNWSIYGETKTGKSTFGLSGTAGDGGGPIIVFDLDRRLEYVVQKHMDDKTILLHKINFPVVDPVSRKKDETVIKEANAQWDKFLELYDMALKSSQAKGGVRRIIIDTSTELFDLRLMAEFGRLMGINPRDRGGANAEYVEIMRRAEKYDASVIWLHHSKDEWENYVDENGKEKSKTTGRVILDGFRKSNTVAQIAARTSFNDKEKDPRKRFQVTIIRCGINSALNNKTFTSMEWAVYDDGGDVNDPPMIDYGPLAYISSLAVPETTPEDWL